MRSAKTPLKILIIHFRVGRTDGVSIEINHWKQILQNSGHIVKLASGPINEGADYVISQLEQQLDPIVFAIDEQAFGKNSTFTESEFKSKIIEIQNSIIEDFKKILNEFNPDRIIISNIFSVGEHVGAAEAFLRVLDEFKIKTLLVHHDFYWENIRYKRPAYTFVQELLDKFYTPKRPYIKHACINSIAKESLQNKKGIKADLIYDTHDFNQKPWRIDQYNSDILSNWKIKNSDVVVLQATRIVRRKNIELAIDFVRRLQTLFDQTSEKKVKLYKNEIFFRDRSKVYLVLAGYAENRDINYFKELMHYAALNRIHLCYIGDSINGTRSEKNGSKLYSLWDAYARCDLITYPSEYEGFGNQFLEAVFAKKPVAVYEYPVFKTDIKDKGFKYISLGSEITYGEKDKLAKIPRETSTSAATQAFQVLTNKELFNETVTSNYALGKKHFSFEVTKSVLENLVID